MNKFLLILLIASACSGHKEAPVSVQNSDGKIIIVDTLFLDPDESSVELSLFNEQTSDALIGWANQRPKTMIELTSGLHKFYYMFDARNQMEVDLTGFASGHLGKREKLLVVDYSVFKWVGSGDKKEKWGVGVRLFLRISKMKKSAFVAKLPLLAATAEFGKAEITYSISTIGITGEKVICAIPPSGEFNVDGYAKVVNAVDEIMKLAAEGGKGVSVVPQYLGH